MKKWLFVFIATYIGLTACQNVEPTTPSVTDEVLSAQIEQEEDTRTVLGESGNVLWSESDQIVAFMKNSYGQKYQIKPSYVGKTYADFSRISSVSGDDISAGMEWDHNIAYYPYADGIECVKSDEDYTLDVILPVEQTYAAESFGNGSWPMVAVSENNDIVFKNVCGGMLLQLKGTQKVTSITIQGKNNEKLSGAATVTAHTDDNKPAITMSVDASTSVTLDCGAGVQLNESTITELIIALPPVVFTKGFIVIVTDSNSNEQVIETAKENIVLRSSLLVMPEVKLDDAEVKPEPQPGDYIDEYGINRHQGIRIGETVWAPVNCGFHEDNFKYGKHYQWGRRFGQDASEDSDFVYGPVSLCVGQSESNSDKFYALGYSPYDWIKTQDDELWNAGTEENPIKTEYDPCPSGWRVPTITELENLFENRSSWTHNNLGQSGYWFSGTNSYTTDAPQVFFPAAGYHNTFEGRSLNIDDAGYYWSSQPVVGHGKSINIYFGSALVNTDPTYRGTGYSIRCVLDDSELIPVTSVSLTESITLDLGAEKKLIATITPANANHKTAIWWSDDENIATIDSNGKIIAVSKGSTTITAMAGMKSATCNIIVK